MYLTTTKERFNTHGGRFEEWGGYRRLTGAVTLTVINDRLIPLLLETIHEKNGCLININFPTKHNQSWAYCLLTTDFYQYLKRRQVFGPVNLSLSGRASSFLKWNLAVSSVWVWAGIDLYSICNRRYRTHQKYCSFEHFFLKSQ